ncbi:MAG: 1,4-beta-xylanase, partial [Actinomycetes bacterium]|nr:1,4-beta-xylanase [Actinomycetes bacterium]MDX5381230.1 1,4-beta-xylanase [Actinomycetes bacterium]MDX5400540.1 1,4-beta-xylanase [Actinomycetes bacterium]MDX5451000.1 1,4-beta-xylanase [Actinomycetes bacterium]
MRFSATSPRPDPTFAHRTGTVRVRVTAEGGAPLANAEVVVRQRDHAFGFGCIGFEFVPLAAGEEAATEGSGLSRGAPCLAGKWFDLFNFATLPFYWGG